MKNRVGIKRRMYGYETVVKKKVSMGVGISEIKSSGRESEREEKRK